MNDYFIGIDLGGTRVKIGLVKDKNIISKVIIPAQSAKGLAASLPFITEHINQHLKDNGLLQSDLGGVALGFPGLVDPFQKKILSTNAKYDDALAINLENWVGKQWNVPFFLDNDARMAAIGEWQFGAGRDTDNLVVMTIGTGIGTSAIIEGKLLRGKHFQAGCLGGHFAVQYNGRQCNCGNVGCMEAYAATWSMRERIIEDHSYTLSSMSSSAVIDFEALLLAADKGDALAMRMQEDCLNIWSAGIVNLIHAYDPEVVVIGGGIMNNKEKVLPYITEYVHKHAWCPWGKVDIRATELLSDAGILGAVYCLQHRV
jgi:glucokinase